MKFSRSILLVICLLALAGCSYFPYAEYHKNGKVAETGHRKIFGVVCGQKYYAYDGQFKAWSYNGQLIADRFYKKGNAQGIARSWYDDGTLKAEVEWRDGLHDGNFALFYETGQLSAKGVYAKGSLKMVEYHDEKGAIITESQWLNIYGNEKLPIDKRKPNQALQHNDPSCHASCLRTPRASRGRG
jgi:hypothetical protein